MTNGRLRFYRQRDNLFLIYSFTSFFFSSVTKEGKIPSLDLWNFSFLQFPWSAYASPSYEITADCFPLVGLPMTFLLHISSHFKVILFHLFVASKTPRPVRDTYSPTFDGYHELFTRWWSGRDLKLNTQVIMSTAITPLLHRPSRPTHTGTPLPLPLPVSCLLPYFPFSIFSNITLLYLS